MEFWVVLDIHGQIQGYFRITQEGFGKGLIINEISVLNYSISYAVLKKLKKGVSKPKPSSPKPPPPSPMKPGQSPPKKTK